MMRKNFIMHYSLFAAIAGVIAADNACGAVRIGNATRNSYYEQQLAEQQRAAQVASVNDIARMSGNASVTDASNSVDANDSARMAACSAIYPNGEFTIAKPTAGIGTGGAKTCVAVVELRGYQMGKNGEDAVLARANVAAGSTVSCNISSFPSSSYTLDAGNVTFPADAEPTVEDVKKVLNQEQKQNAGLKIAAAALVGGLGGNISGDNDIGKDGLFGTSKSKITNTVIGAVGGAAIGAGGAYAGKVGGDMIMSAGINAAAGGVIGNIAAAGDSVLRVERCKDEDGKEKEKTCLWGYLVTGPTLEKSDENANALCTDKADAKTCFIYYIDLNDGKSVMRCNVDNKKCTSVTNLISIYVDGSPSFTSVKALESLERKDLDSLKTAETYRLVDGEESTKTMESGIGGTESHTYKLITAAKIDDGPKQPALVKGFKDGAFGKKSNDWTEWKREYSTASIYYRNADGSSGKNLREDDPKITLDNFYPMYVDAEDGGIVDLGNKARLKSTLIGAGAGGALGAFTAYQGAQSDIDERWVSAVREYKDSLQKFYCITGSRFLSYYNDVVLIPNVSE